MASTPAGLPARGPIRADAGPGRNFASRNLRKRFVSHLGVRADRPDSGGGGAQTPPMTQRRITQQDIARRAGLNRATISLAIRNHPSIAAATRERVQKLAEEMGYCPDPMLSALAAYRNSSREPGFRGSLGWLAISTKQFMWRQKGHFVRYLAGAEKQAEKMGYRIQVIDLGELGIRWERAASMVRAQGIHGLLLCPQPTPDTKIEAFPWHEFSAVKFGYSITYPQLQSVAAAQFRASQRVVEELRERGYRRIGFVGQRGHDERTGHNYFGGFLSAMTYEQWQELVPPYWFESDNDKGLIEWFERYRPDAVVASMEFYYQALVAAGYEAPRDFGFACPAAGDANPSISGVQEADERVGAAAVEILVAMIQRGEHGMPPYPQRLLVEGRWNEGSTLRPLVPPAPAKARSVGAKVSRRA